MPTNDLTILARMRLALIEGLASNRDVVVNGGLTSLFHASNTLMWVNQTVAVGEVDDEALDACVAAYEARGRTPFFEFCPALAPNLERMLVARGAFLELATPIMATRDVPSASSLNGRLATPDDARAMCEIGCLAFGQPGPTQADIDGQRKSIETGSNLHAVAELEWQVVAIGQAFGSQEVMEVAGIGTHPDFRRRGAAKAVIRTLLDEFFNRGGEIAWLTPGGDDAKSLYESLGFREIGTQVAYRL